MRTPLLRILVVQAVPELAAYTCGLLDDIGFRHITQASSAREAIELLRSARENARMFQAVVCDDGVLDGDGQLLEACGDVPVLAISGPESPHNLQLAARLGLSGLIFRPYGRAQVESAIAQIVRD